MVCDGPCGQEREEAEFETWKVKGVRYYRKACRICRALERRRRRRSDPIPSDLKRRGETAAKKKLVDDLKASTSCKDCGLKYHPCVMDFDHVRGEKVEHVSVMISRGYSLEAIQAEIAKCELVCSNCHRMRTFRRR